jgi:hypothetical protein
MVFFARPVELFWQWKEKNYFTDPFVMLSKYIIKLFLKGVNFLTDNMNLILWWLFSDMNGVGAGE